MSARYAPYSLRSWLIIVALVVPYLLVKESFGITYPSWLQWTAIVAAGLVGAAILVRTDLAAMRSSTLARLVGAALVLASAFARW